MLLDIAEERRAGRLVCCARMKTLVWNGPSGVRDGNRSDTGTVRRPRRRRKLTAAGKLVSVAGGGGHGAALNAAGVTDRLTYVRPQWRVLEWMEGSVAGCRSVRT